jgi:hypothetical protein
MEVQPFLLVIEVNGFGGTELLAGPAFALLKVNAVFLVYDVLQGNGLSILHINRLALAQALIIGIVHFFGTFFCTGSTGNTLLHIHKTRVLEDLNLEMARFPFDVYDFRESEKFNV